MTDFYFTFGTSHFNHHKVCMGHHWVKVTAKDWGTARHIFVEEFSMQQMETPQKWSHQYREEEFKKSMHLYQGGEYMHLNESGTLEHLSDVVRFKGIINYLNGDPKIECLVKLGPDEDLGRIAYIFHTGQVKKLEQLHTDGRVVLETVSETNPENSVDVIRMEPFYLYKDRGTPHQ